MSAADWYFLAFVAALVAVQELCRQIRRGMRYHRQRRRYHYEDDGEE